MLRFFISGATIIDKKSREFLLFKRYLTPLFCPGLWLNRDGRNSEASRHLEISVPISLLTGHPFVT